MDLPIENGGSFHSYVNVYRRVTNFHQPFTHLSFTVPTDFGQLFMKGYATGTIPNLQLSSLFIVEQPIHPHQCLVLYAQCHFVRSILLNLLIKFSFFPLFYPIFLVEKKVRVIVNIHKFMGVYPDFVLFTYMGLSENRVPHAIHRFCNHMFPPKIAIWGSKSSIFRRSQASD